MIRQQSPACILACIALRTVAGLLCMIAIPLAIVGMLVFNVLETIRNSRAWKWFVGRRA